MMLQTALVPFRGQTLLTVRDGEQVRVAIRPICEALGLDWSGQYRATHALRARPGLLPALRHSEQPRFLGVKAVNSPLQCWVFEAGSGVA